MTTTHDRINYNHGHLAYQITGVGEAVVFIHGFALDHRMWQPQVEFFSRQFRVITYDARGFGRSSVPTGPYNHADDLAALLRHLGVTTAHIVGLSMGGRIAVNFALEYPGLVRSLALLDAALDGYASTVDWDVRACTAGIGQAKQNWLTHELFVGTHDQGAKQLLSTMVADYSGWHWLQEDPQDPADTNARARLGEISVPTLVVVGRRDLGYFRDIAGVLAAGIPQARLVTVPGVGHMVNLEAAEVVNQLLLSHTKSEPSAGPTS